MPIWRDKAVISLASLADPHPSPLPRRERGSNDGGVPVCISNLWRSQSELVLCPGFGPYRGVSNCRATTRKHTLSKALFSPLPSWERARVRVMPRRRRGQSLESLSKGGHAVHGSTGSPRTARTDIVDSLLPRTHSLRGLPSDSKNSRWGTPRLSTRIETRSLPSPSMRTKLGRPSSSTSMDIRASP